MSNEAKALRSELRAAGFKGRDVTVKHNYFSMGSEIVVTIRNPEIERKAVKEVATSYERISRCEFSGEILGGGNTYLDVNYSEAALEVRKNAVLPNINIALERLAAHPSDNCLEPAGDALIGSPNHDGFHNVYMNDRHIGRAYPDQYAAGAIAQLIVG